jgi:GT2 family glycosyltransferase
MNIILLALDEVTGAQAVPVGGPDRRLPQLRNWLAWFAEHGEPLWVQSYLPPSNLEAQSEVIRFLIESARDFGTGTSLIINPADVGAGILKHPYLRCLDEIILTLDPEEEELGEPFFQTVETYCAELSDQKQELNLWVKEGTHRGWHARVQPWLRRKQESTNIFTAPYILGRPDTQPKTEATAAPVEYLQEPPSCRLFENSLTIASDARIIACPLHAGQERIVDLGNLFVNSPESVLVKRGRELKRQLSGPICRGCHIDGRFSWPESRGETVYDLIQLGRTGQAQGMDEELGRVVPYILSELSPDAIEQKLGQFKQTLSEWSLRNTEPLQDSGQSFVSIETPVIKGDWLIQCIESVLAQSSPRWQLSLLWDKGDELAKRILRVVEEIKHPRLSVYYSKGLGIARARKFLTEHSSGDYILALDDDDTLAPNTVERFLEAASQMPGAGIIRGRRGFIDSSGNAVKMDDWFPFEPRHYLRGMTCDVYNHCQPYLISRAAYARTDGWEGFPEFKYAGEDCDIFLKIEEVAEIELIDDVLYHYRINQSRTSLGLGTEVAHEMWRRLADKALSRRGGLLRRTKDMQPFTFEPVGEEAAVAAKNQGSSGKSSSGKNKPKSPDILFVTLPEGARELRQQALRDDAPPYICLLGENVGQPSRPVLEQLVQALRAQDADLASPKMLDMDGRLVGADPYFTANMLPGVRGTGEADRGQYDFDAAAPWLLPSCLLVRTSVFRSIGDLDTTYLSNELRSADFCLRARGRGFRCAYVGSVAVVQQGGETKSPPQDEIDRFTARWGRFVHLLYATEEMATA